MLNTPARLNVVRAGKSMYFKGLIIAGIFLLVAVHLKAARAWEPGEPGTSTVEQALTYLNSIKKLDKSRYWPNVNPDLLLENLKTFTIKPLAFYEGKPTNFCAYSSITYIPLTYDPLGFSKFMIHLYRYGRAEMGKVVLRPGKKVRFAAGLIKYKSDLDVNPAGQMWFLSLADHFKGYLNLLNYYFNPGDENTFWAATNFAKFNRMLRQLFPGKVQSRGSDLLRPSADIYKYLEQQMPGNVVFLYLNNKKLYKKTHVSSFIKTPTHYVLVIKVEELPDGNIEFVYWDYGRLTLQQVSKDFFESIIYGITTYYPIAKK